MDLLPGVGGGWFRAGGLLVHDYAAVRQHLQERSWTGTGDHIPFRRTRSQHPGYFFHRCADRDGHRVSTYSPIHCVRCRDRYADAWFFRADDEVHNSTARNNQVLVQGARVSAKTWIFFGLLLGVLIAGTLQIGLLTDSYATFTFSGSWAMAFQEKLDRIVPPNASLGIEGVSVQGVFLIGMLILIAVTSWFGLNQVDEGFNTWTYMSLGLISLTLLVASFKVVAITDGLSVGFTGKLIAEGVLITVVWWMAAKRFEEYEVQEWLWEMWRFVKQIIPLLLVGVFLAGMARTIIPATWIEAIAGHNTWWANLVGVLFGVFMYFPTLVEVPIAQTFLSLGMHRGPLLAYLLADPELSLQSILITNSVIGRKKTTVYVILVAIFSTLSGMIFGWFIR